MPRGNTQAKTAIKKTAGAKKATAKKAQPRKVAKKVTAKKSAVKKAVKTPKAPAKKTTTKKAISKKTATRKAVPKKGVAKKATNPAKESTTKKIAISKKKDIAKKTAPKKTVNKKTKPEKIILKDLVEDKLNDSSIGEEPKNIETQTQTDDVNAKVEELIEADRQVFNEITVIEQSDERRKRFFLWASVSVTMVVIVFLWALNLKTVFKHDNIKEADSGSDWKAIKSEISSSYQEIRNEIDNIKNMSAIEKANATEPGKMQELKNHLKELEQKLEG